MPHDSLQRSGCVGTGIAEGRRGRIRGRAGAGGKGVSIPAPGYLRNAAALCRKHGALFIDDEAQSRDVAGQAGSWPSNTMVMWIRTL